MLPSADDPSLNIPKFGNIILDDNTLVSHKYLGFTLALGPTDLLFPQG